MKLTPDILVPSYYATPFIYTTQSIKGKNTWEEMKLKLRLKKIGKIDRISISIGKMGENPR